jgi:hypothetical protein
MRKRHLQAEKMKQRRDFNGPNGRNGGLARWAATRRLSLERCVGPSRVHPASQTSSKKSHSRLKNDPSDRTGETSPVSESNRSRNVYPSLCISDLDMNISLHSHDNNLMHQEMPSQYADGSVRHIQQLFSSEMYGHHEQRPSARELSIARDSFRVHPTPTSLQVTGTEAVNKNDRSNRMDSLRFQQASL